MLTDGPDKLRDGLFRRRKLQSVRVNGCHDMVNRVRSQTELLKD